MKALIITMALAALTAIGEEDLGVITGNMAISLEKSNRPDFHSYIIELQQGTNRVQFRTTNETLQLKHFTNLPSGLVVMAVKAFCVDGSESEPALYRFHLQREAPKPPGARAIHILKGDERTDGLEETLRKRARDKPVVHPPAPPGASLVPSLPDGTNSSYSEHLRRMAEVSQGGRRSE